MPDGLLTVEPLRTEEFSQLMAECVPAGVQKLAVAVSGGADSMALCLLAADWAQAKGVELTALTVDHGLRPESSDEAQQVSAWLDKRSISHHILTWQGGQQRSTAVQERARNARYDLMRVWCLQNAVGHLLLAHHMEDQAETVLMRLKKGTGLMGMAGMAKSRDLDGVQVLRPLLDVQKGRLRSTLLARGQDWIDDPSNQNPAFERVRTRQLLDQLQDEGVSAQRLAGAARACAQVRQILEVAADERLQAVAKSEKGVQVAARVLQEAPSALLDVMLTKLLKRVGGGGYPPAQDKRQRLADWVRTPQSCGGAARTLAGCEVRRVSGGFLFRREEARKTLKKGRN